MAFTPFYAPPQTLTSFEQLCDLIDNGCRTEVSDIPGTVIVVDSSKNEARYDKIFNISKEDKKGLEAQIGEFILKGQNRDSMPVTEQQFYREGAEELTKKIQAYVHCLPDETRATLTAFCNTCLGPANLGIRGKFIEGTCSNCGSSLG